MFSPLSSNRPRENVTQKLATPIVKPLEPEQVKTLVSSLGGVTELKMAIGLFPEQLVKAVTDYPGLSQVAELPGGKYVGHLYAKWSGTKSIYIQNIWVDPSVRKMGVALSMVQSSIENARRTVPNLTAIAIVLVGNEPAENLFLKAGFVASPIANRQSRGYVYTEK